MKGKARLLMVLAALSPLCLQAQGIADIIKALRTAQSYTARATFTVTLPSRDDDVTYRLSLAGTPSPADTLSPCSYLLQWELDTPSGPSRGWSSYFNGNLYAYRDHRIREYHTSWDPSPFASAKGSRTTGVQRTTQFVSLLPHYLADELTAMSADTLHTICPPQPASCDGTDAIRIDTRMTVNSETVQEKSYWFDSATLLPLRIDTESNPGSITEQSISVRYTPTATPAEVPQTEETLISLFPEHFEKYRESNFSIENLSGTPLPTFALPTATGERYTHHRGEPFRAPTVIALLDPSTSFSPRIVNDLRTAIDSSPTAADIIWAVTGTDTDAAENTAPGLRPGEHLLINSSSLARDCGAASLPVILIADTSGTVRKVILGYTADLPTLILQSIALLTPTD
ncbi:hypothetical protein [Duncaniella freteri]|uniref:hypothetical protein n=1 Tax=Duncaniella freteri TaxID=2530391 RepID=UPI0025732129|nr:hypothetical protein [Duncaniella freteri]